MQIAGIVIVILGTRTTPGVESQPPFASLQINRQGNPVKSPKVLSLKSATRDSDFSLDDEGNIWCRKWPIVAHQQTHDKAVINIDSNCQLCAAALRLIAAR